MAYQLIRYGEAGDRHTSLIVGGVPEAFVIVSPYFLITRNDEDDPPCPCLVRARLCSTGEKIEFALGEDIDGLFTSTWLINLICCYFDPDDERIAGAGAGNVPGISCFAPGAPASVQKLDGDCEACLSGHADPDLYYQAYRCKTGEPVDLWAKQADVTTDQVYWAGAVHGCVTFRGVLFVEPRGTLADLDALTPIASCDACEAAHQYIRGYDCRTDRATSVWALSNTVDKKKFYGYGGLCFYFAGPTSSTPGVTPIAVGDMKVYDTCPACNPKKYFQAARCSDPMTPINYWVAEDVIDNSKVYKPTEDSDCLLFPFPADHPPAGALLVDTSLGEAFDDCVSCLPPCPSDNSGALSGDLDFIFDWGSCHISPTPPTSLTATPTGSGGWTGSVDYGGGTHSLSVTVACQDKTDDDGNPNGTEWVMAWTIFGPSGVQFSGGSTMPHTSDTPPSGEWTGVDIGCGNRIITA